MKHRSMISAWYFVFHLSSSIGSPLGPTWSTSQILVRLFLTRCSKFLEFFAMKMHSGLKTVGIGTLRGLSILCGSGLIDLTVRILESLTTIVPSPLILERLMVIVFCFFAEVRLTRAALLARFWFIGVDDWKTSLLRGDIRMFDTR